MAGVRKKPRSKDGKYQGWFTDSSGKRRFFAGVQDRDDTLRMALRLEDDHRQVRLGYRPEKAKADRFRTRPYSEIATDYLKWGCAQGGRGGRPWSEGHASRRRFQVAWWQEQLSLETLADLDGVLPGVERVAQEMLAAGKAGKTVANEIEALRAFCTWCLTRKYLKEDPLAGLAPFDTTPQIRYDTTNPTQGDDTQRSLDSAQRNAAGASAAL